MHKIGVLFFLTLFLVSCERYEEIEVDAPYKPKVVVSSFLQSKSNMLFVAVTRSQPVFNVEPLSQLENTPTYIKDASVTFRQGANSYTLLYDTIQNVYRMDMPTEIHAGELYELTVTSGNETVQGTTTIPESVNADLKLQFDSTLQWDGTYQYRATIKCTLLDAGKHYILLYPILVYSDSTTNMMYTDGIGKIMEISGGETVTTTFLSSFSAIGVTSERIEVAIVACDKAFAKNSTNVLDLFGSNISPFTEPAITYSNMTGGIGVIGSVNPETLYRLNLR